MKRVSAGPWTARRSRSRSAVTSCWPGAGFGGCTVSLVPDNRLEPFMEEVGQRYFEDAIRGYPEAHLRYREKSAAPLLALKPSSGARVLFPLGEN